MQENDFKREKKSVTITTKDWINYLAKEKQKKNFRIVTITEILDEIIVREFLRVQRLKKQQDKNTDLERREFLKKLLKEEETYLKDEEKKANDEADKLMLDDAKNILTEIEELDKIPRH